MLRIVCHLWCETLGVLPAQCVSDEGMGASSPDIWLLLARLKQLLFNYRGYEGWGNFPSAKTYLLPSLLPHCCCCCCCCNCRFYQHTSLLHCTSSWPPHQQHPSSSSSSSSSSSNSSTLVQFPQAAAHPAVARMCLMHRYVGGGERVG